MYGERGLRLQVGVLFAFVALAFVGVNVLVISAAWPQVRRVEFIYGDLGESLHLIAQMRGAAQELRSTATEALLERFRGELRGGDDDAAKLAAAAGRLSRLGAAYEPLVSAGEEAEVWSALRDRELPSLAARAAALIERSHAGEVPRSDKVEGLMEHSARVDDLFQHLGRIAASQVQQSAEEIHASLIRLLLLCALLLVLGGAGAALLLARSLSLIRRWGVAMDVRMAELDAFASRVAHDLRSPLQTISLSLARIGARAGDEPTRSTAARAERGVARLNAMVSDLLEFARSGATPEPGARADVAAVLEEVREELQPVAERAGVRLAPSAAPGVHAAASGMAVRAIVANLVENGIKYTREDGERLVAVAARAHGRAVRIEVRDTGIGIPAARLATIFDPFVHARARRDSYGLGLATVKRLVAAHGGTVAVESKEGEGTTFTVELPRAVGVEDE